MEIKFDPTDLMDSAEKKMFCFYEHLLDAVILEICKDEPSSARFLVRESIINTVSFLTKETDFSTSLAATFFQGSSKNYLKAIAEYNFEPFSVTVKRRPDGTPTRHLLTIEVL